MHKSFLKEIEKQSDEVLDQIDFIRDNIGLPPFTSERATPEELLQLITNSVGEFKEAAEWHVPIYIGRCFIDELQGHWYIESKKQLAMYGKPYVNGFGNIGYENLYLPQLMVTDREDVNRIKRLWKQSRRAYDIRERFRKEFEPLSGTIAIREDIETRCMELGLLPKSSIRFKVDRARVPLYCKDLKIKLKKG